MRSFLFHFVHSTFLVELGQCVNLGQLQGRAHNQSAFVNIECRRVEAGMDALLVVGNSQPVVQTGENLRVKCEIFTTEGGRIVV